MPKVGLQVTLKQAALDYPEGQHEFTLNRRRLVHLLYDVTPSKCLSALAQWLASVILTTDARYFWSHVKLLCPYSRADFRVAQFMADLEQHRLGAFSEGTQGTQKRDPLGTYAHLVREHLALIGRYQGHEFSWEDKLATKLLVWPAYKHKDCGYADTPEAYFNYVANHLHQKQFVVLLAGKDKLPAELVPTYGRPMLDRYYSENWGRAPSSGETRTILPWIKRVPMRLPGYREKTSTKHKF